MPPARLEKFKSVNMFKYIFSQDWKFEDYKVDISEHPEYSEKNLRFSAKFINALDRRFGSTPKEAIEKLKIIFADYKKNKKLPRPGASECFQTPLINKI